MPAEFWQTEEFRQAFAAQHMGRVARAYRTHPYHHAVYGPSGISQPLLGQWLGLQQPQVSRIETGPPIRDLDKLVYWVRVLRIPVGLLWFRLPPERDGPAVSESATSRLAVTATTNGVLESPSEIVARRAGLQTSSLTGELLAELEQFLTILPDRYETAGPLARGTQSLATYYTGDYRGSLTYARDGQRYAKDGVQAVRLTINGEARALGKLQDHDGTAAAVARAYRLLEGFPQADGMTPCISFGMYSEARTASNAATAYLSLRQPKQVLAYAERARKIIDLSPSRWSYALVRLDMAVALVNAEQPEPEGASTFGAEALDAVRYQRIESIQQRTRELAVAVRPWRHLRSVADFLDDASSWLATDWGGSASQ